ncbi:MAG TPA: serine hydrolase [Dokdonella sp.]|nr:serine hydrolase [Dokdonella sp.]
MPKRTVLPVLCLLAACACAAPPSRARSQPAAAVSASRAGEAPATTRAAAREAAIVRDAALPSGVRVHAEASATPALVDAIVRADAALFGAVFDRCDAANVRALVTDDLEFYHDRGGVVADSGDRFADVIRRQCEARRRGDEPASRRELVPGTLEVYPVGEAAAIETGVHRFYQRDAGGRETLVGAARFLHVWRNEDGAWRVARVASYDHHGVDAAPAASAEGASASDPRAALDALVPALLAARHVPSASIALIEAGRVAFVAAYGEQAPGVPATTRTLYNVASLSKPLSAELALRLVAAGRITLDEPMAKTWTDPDIADDERRWQLTPRFALSHRTGLPNWRRESGGKLAFLRAPGEAFGYSGEGYEYLARFIEKKLDTPFERLAERTVLAPLGLRDTAYTRRPWFDGRVARPADADGRFLEPAFATRALASDLVYSTPSDYAAFIVAVMHGDGVTPALAAERARVQASRMRELCPAPAPDCPSDAGFGLGWEVYRYGEARVLMHTGMDDGVFTLAYFSPDRGSGLVLFTNGANGPQLVMPILGRLGRDRDFVATLRRQAP